MPWVKMRCVNDLVQFVFGALQGELNQDSITKEDLQVCRDKYEDELIKEAEVHISTRKVLYVVLSKP